MTFTEFFTKLAEFAKQGLASCIVILLFTSFCLFLPDSVLSLIGIKSFIEQSKTHLGISFLISLSILLVIFGKTIFSKWQHYSWRKQIFAALTEEELNILWQYFKGQTKTRRFSDADGVVTGLVSRGILYRSTNLSIRPPFFDFNIQPWTWKYLNKNPHIFKNLEKQSTELKEKNHDQNEQRT